MDLFRALDMSPIDDQFDLKDIFDHQKMDSP
jgi:hypothetical protein